MMLSEHFSLEELTASDTAARLGIDNDPPANVVANLKLLAARLEQARVILGVPIRINSGYRCPALNQAVHGSKSSVHMSGLAADIIAPKFGSPLDVCRALAKSLDYDQIIHEGKWCHFGIVSGGASRKQLLTAHFGGEQGTTYSDGLVNI